MKKVLGLMVMISVSCVMGLIGSSVEKALYFLVDKDYTIVRCFASNMEFALPESVFMSQNIVDVVHIGGVSKEEVEQVFQQAYQDRIITSVSYTLMGQSFKAEITPLFNDQEDGAVDYCIKVTEE